MKWIVLAALAALSCGKNPAAPTSYSAIVALAGGPTVGQCVDVRCAYTVSVINQGPSCADHVAATILFTTGLVNRSGFNQILIGVAAPTVVRVGQVVTLSGADWPTYGSNPQVTVTGLGTACP